MGFSGSSPLLSSKSLYPLYFRTNPSETFANLGRIAILRRFNWKRVAILQQNNDVFTGISNSLVELLEAANFSVIAYESFKDHPRFAIENLKVQGLSLVFNTFSGYIIHTAKITMKMISLKARAQMRHYFRRRHVKSNQRLTFEKRGTLSQKIYFSRFHVEYVLQSGRSQFNNEDLYLITVFKSQWIKLSTVSQYQFTKVDQMTPNQINW